MSQATRITYEASEMGYTVTVWAADKVLDTYNAGNFRHESTTYVSPRSPDAVPPAELAKMARQTAVEFANENGLPESAVSEEITAEAV